MLAATTTAVVQAQDSSGFADVDPNSVHAPAINALAESGVIAGTECAEGQICPDEPFLRWTMAVWMIRALDLEPSSEPNSFSDIDPGEWWAPYVQRLSEIGVTKGCRTNPARYCPNRAVARAEMASFLARAFQLEAATDQPFTDVNTDDTHATNIAALAKSRITAGCKTNPNRYCPNRTVTNAEMASFLARATKQIPLPEQPTTSNQTTTTAAGPQIAMYGVGDSNVTYAIQSDRTIVCSNPDLTVPTGSYVKIQRDEGIFCALSTDQSLHCSVLADSDITWENQLEIGTDFAVSRSSLSDFAIHAIDNYDDEDKIIICGVTSEVIECWDLLSDMQLSSLAGTFRSVTFGCAIDTDQRVVCWDPLSGDLRYSPPGNFKQLESDGIITCGIQLNDAISCWGHDGDYRSATQVPVEESDYRSPSEDVPLGEYIQLFMDNDSITHCALSVEGQIKCWIIWGYDMRPMYFDSHTGNYVYIVGEWWRSQIVECAFADTRRAECHGDDSTRLEAWLNSLDLHW